MRTRDYPAPTWFARIVCRVLMFVSGRNARWSLMAFNRMANRWPWLFYRIVQR